MRIVKRFKIDESWFTDYSCKEDYIKSGCEWCEPMLAQEATDTEQELYFDSTDFMVEEKFDGTRGILQFFDIRKTNLLYQKNVHSSLGFTRCFSRRVSKKTGWFCENTDSLPQLRSINKPELHGTIIDGEMFIDGKPFKCVSSTLNCIWSEAVNRQNKLGFVTFHAFDIIRYKGIDCTNMPLIKRKQFLEKVINTANSKYLVMVPYYVNNLIEIHMTIPEYRNVALNRASYPNLWSCIKESGKILRKETFIDMKGVTDSNWVKYFVSKRAYYEYIISKGGEGVILKPCNGRYLHKRCKNFLKVKKFFTRDVIICGYTEPTKEYQGSFNDDRWLYWVNDEDERLSVEVADNTKSSKLLLDGFTPVTKHYYYNQVGNIVYGVIVSDSDKLPKDKVKDFEFLNIGGKKLKLAIVGECSGMSDSDKEYITEHKKELIGSVVEVGANEVFKDTGKLRHPRFLRLRPDKNSIECTWRNHVGD